MFDIFLIVIAILVIPLYPKFPLVGVSGSYVSVRLEDFLVLGLFLYFAVKSVKNRFAGFFDPMPRTIILYLFIGAVASFSGIFLTKTASLNLGLLHYFRRVEYMVLFFAGMAALKNVAHLSFISRTVLFTSLVVALYGLGQIYLGLPVISTTNSEFAKGLALTLGPGARINSTFAGHYDLAAFCIFPLMFVIALLPLSKNKWPLIFIGGLVYWVLLLSASRITFVSFFVCAAALIMMIRKPVWIIPLVFLSLVGILASPQLRGRYLELITNHLRFSYVTSVSAQEEKTESKDVNETPDALKPPAQPEDRSFNIRIQAEWPRALRAIAFNPILGTGYSSVGLAIDNDYLRTASETGIFGLAAFLLIFLRFFKLTLPSIMSPSKDLSTYFVLAVFCSVLGLLINSVFIDIFAASKIAIFSWLMMGLAYKSLILSGK